MKQAITYFCIFILCQILGSAVVAVPMMIFGNSTEMAALQITLSSACASLLTLFVFLKAKWFILSTAFIKTKPISILLLSVFAALAALVPSAWLQELLPEEMTKDLMSDTFEMLLRSPFGIVSIVIFAPIVEEVVFRGAVLRSLLEWVEKYQVSDTKKAIVPIVLSAMLFSLIHMNPAQMPHAFVIGLLLGWLYYRTGSILPGVVFHWVNNSAAFIMAQAFPELSVDAKLVEYLGSQNNVLIALAVSVALFIPAVWMLDKTMTKPTKTL